MARRGINSATLLGSGGANEEGADPATLEPLADGVSAAAAGFDHGLLVQGGKVAVFGPAHRPPGTAPGLLLAPVPFKVAITAVAAGTCAGTRAVGPWWLGGGGCAERLQPAPAGRRTAGAERLEACVGPRLG